MGSVGDPRGYFRLKQSQHQVKSAHPLERDKTSYLPSKQQARTLSTPTVRLLINMNCRSRAAVSLALFAVAVDAAATDYSGLAVTFVGIPAFLAFCVLLAVLLKLRPGKVKRAIACIAAVICTLLAIAVIKDAARAIRYPSVWVSVALLAGLIAISAFLFYRLMRKPLANGADTSDV
jgi:hypothetical protein